jgi:hypothetical protein
MLTTGLAGVGLPPPEQALPDLRHRLGPAPLTVLFEAVAGLRACAPSPPAAQTP